MSFGERLFVLVVFNQSDIISFNRFRNAWTVIVLKRVAKQPEYDKWHCR